MQGCNSFLLQIEKKALDSFGLSAEGTLISASAVPYRGLLLEGVVAVAFSSLAWILGEDSMIHSPPWVVFFF